MPRKRPKFISWRQAVVGETLYIIPAGAEINRCVEIQGVLAAISRIDLSEAPLRNERGFGSSNCFRLEADEQNVLRRLDNWRPIRLVDEASGG